LENPIESSEDTRATVDMLYEMPRPYTLNIYALRIIEAAVESSKTGGFVGVER